MADTYTLIEKITVGAAGASSVTFTSIPQTFTDLVVKWSARVTDTATDSVQVVLQFNGDTGSNYSRRSLYGDGGAAGSSSATTTFMRFGWASTNGNTANTFGQGEFYVPNYTGSSQKSVSADGVAESNATQYIYAGLHAGLWTGTSAISSITLSVPSWSFVQYSTFYLYGIAKEGVSPAPSSAPYATGGDSIVFDGTYWIHTFTSSGTFTPKKNLSCDYLVVAGGGGGGLSDYGSTWAGGGGGAGGLRSTVTATGGGGSLESALSLTANTGYTVTIGAGGAGSTSFNNKGSNGNNSVFSTITSSGGGGGGSNYSNAGANGGSGGGSGHSSTGGSGTTNQGYAGGSAGLVNSGGGGGGAGSVGSDGSGTVGANGGAGVTTSISGSSVAYAGGGGGSGFTGGGTGGAGAGNGSYNNVSWTATIPNRGGGGGGSVSQQYNPAGAGGSGIVIVRYAA